MSGHEYDPTYQYTVGDLIQLNLGICGSAAEGILAAAIAELRAEQKLCWLHNLWNEKEFKFAKHLPESLLKAGKIAMWRQFELYNLNY